MYDNAFIPQSRIRSMKNYIVSVKSRLTENNGVHTMTHTQLVNFVSNQVDTGDEIRIKRLE